MNKKEQPRYRATQDGTHTGLSIFNAGAEFVLMTWPKVAAGAIEPANEAGERVWAYWHKHRTNVFLPAGPYDPELGRIYLPAIIPDPRSTALPSLPEQELRGMPRYKTRFHQNFGARHVRAGQEVAFLFWPVDSFGLVPVNDAASSVVDYFSLHAGNPKLPLCPWCDFERALCLPDLPEIKQPQFARDLSEARPDSYESRFNEARVKRAQATLRKSAQKTWESLNGAV